ncbi:hypothetical protein PENSPDRAFT_757605 [Peniophora sp. CONT]|nr:hypothetical protein PENSPDRAFT_757605 [Peniophora sp. CONT]
MSGKSLILYDITSFLSDKAYSRNVWRIRYVLNIKCIPYQTRWLSHPEIEPELKRIGASPTSHWMLKSQAYTLPVIHDPARAMAISDSNKIAAYIEDTYPATRFLRVTESINFVQSFGARLNESLFPLLVASTAENLLPETRAAWRAKREHAYGTSLEAMAEPEEKRRRLIHAVLDVLVDIHASSNSMNGPYIQDDELTYRDVAIAATLTNTRRLGGTEGDLWGLIMEAQEGRWKRLMDRFAEWEVVDDGYGSESTTT